MALTKITLNALADSSVDTDAVGANTITTTKIADTNVTHAKLHTDMDLSGKTVTLPSAITDTITNKLPLAGGTLTGTLNIDVADLFVKDTTGGAQGQVQIGAGTAQGFINIQKGDGTRNVQISSDGDTYFNGGSVGIGADPSSYSSYKAVIRRDDATAWPSPLAGSSSGEAVLALINNSQSSFAYSNLVLRAGTGDCGIAAVYQNAANNSDLVFYTDAGLNGSEQMRLTHEGNVGIGTTSPNRKLEVVSDIDGSPLRIQGNSSVTQMEFAVSGGAVEAGIASSANELAFRVGSSSSSAEKLRITTAGYYYFNSTGGHGPGGMVNITNGGTNTVTANALNVRSDTSNYALTLTNTVNGDCIWFSDNGTNGRGSIEVTSTGTTYNTTSDRRLKDNITTITNGKEKLLAMNPVTHTWKADSNTGETVHGFIAQEMQEIVPEAVSGDPDSDKMMSMDYGRITPVIVAALQDALKEIKELKTRISELENN